MFYTKNDFPERIRQQVNNILQKRLADAIDLTLQAKQAHWNIKGDNFISLHELFDKIHENVESHTDLIAERIAQLGGIAEGTCKIAAKNSTLPEYPLMIFDARDHVELISSALSIFTKALRHGIEQTQQFKDAVTADILTQISRDIEKNLWMVEAHLSKEKQRAKTAKGRGKQLEMERLNSH